MHLYVRSMVSPLYELMKIYESEGYLSIQPWLRITLLTISELQFNPNINVEFGNQDAAQTDCLLQYKESASFIAFMDLDDLLIPRVSNTYLDEFAHIFQSLPNVAYIHYLRENTKLSAGREVEIRHMCFVKPQILTELSLSEMLSSIQFDEINETGKLVVDVRYINTTWTHYPVSIAGGMESSVNRMRNKAHLTNILSRLPKSFVYLPVIAKCFEDIFYKYHHSERLKNIKCPGPDRCQVGEDSHKNERLISGWFHSISDGSKFNLHFATDAKFVEQDGCRP
uniref:Glycosyltransferase family 92 protein n=1 Tax=Angiostrongylus cantonensis TaxID=6313 RepID=A0A0K0DAE9_ANGCA